MSFTLEQAIKGLDDRNNGFSTYTQDEYDEMEDIIEMNKTIDEIQDKKTLLKQQEKDLKQQKKELKQQAKEKEREQKQQEKEKQQEEKQQEKEKEKEEKQQARDKKKKNAERVKELLIDRECAVEYVKLYCDNVKIINKKPLIAYMWDEKSKLWLEVDEFKISQPIYNVLLKYFKELLSKDADLFLLVKEALGCDDKLRKIKNQVYNIIDKDNTFDILNLNKSTYELPIKNGKKINLKTLEVEDRKITDYFSFELNVDFMGVKYDLETVNKFMGEVYKKYDDEKKELITDLELVDYHKRFFGYCLSGDIGDRSLHINVGVGCNGKSSIVNIFKNITGNFTKQLSPNVMIKKSTSTLTPELEVLKDARLALMPESEKGDEIKCGFIKSFTGGDEIDCRPLYRKNITFNSPAKAILNTQFVPKIPDDKAMWDRIKIVMYLAVFDNTLENTAYIKKLQTEHLSDFFTYFCYGAQEYFKSGFGKCDSMNKALDDFKSNSNVVLCFIKDKYEYIPLSQYYTLSNDEKSPYRIPRTQIYTDFTNWCDDENNKEYRNLTRNEFYKEVRKHLGELENNGIYNFICKYKQPIENNTAIVNNTTNKTAILNFISKNTQQPTNNTEIVNQII